MVFCQSCGARNTEDARFCNMCGAKIAVAGEPGGPVAKVEGGGAAPQADGGTGPLGASAQSGATGARSGAQPAGTETTMSGSSVSLSAIGVRSSGRTYGILIGAGVLLFALGAVGMWLVMRPGETPPVAEGEGEGPLPGDEEPIEIGEPVPAGDEAPEEIDFVPGTPRVARTDRPTKRTTTPRTGGSGASGAGGSGSSGAGESGAGESGSGGSGSGGSGSSGAGSSGAGGTGTAGSGSGAGGGGSGGSGAGSGAGTTPPGEAGGSGSEAAGSGAEAGGSGSGSGGGSPPVDWDRAGGGAPSEEDQLMDAYAAHVRRYIREYYLRRAQACFDHETRVDQAAVRGTVLIGFTILGSGEVRGATVDRNTTGRDSLGSCLQRQVAAWRLPRPPEGVDELAMQMPFSR